MQGHDDGSALDRAYAEEVSPDAVPLVLGGDERRMHVRAYNHWASLLKGRAYPLIEDLEPQALEDFGPHSVLLDFTHGADDASIAWLGRKLREECGLGDRLTTLTDVPPRSLLSRLTDHYLQIIANRAPIGFEAEFVSGRGANTMYRGILMPYSSDGDHIDFIYGVINWKELDEQPAPTDSVEAQVDQALKAAPARPVAAIDVWADGPHADEVDAELDEDDEDTTDVVLTVDAHAGLADWLVAARESADLVKTADSRSRTALYRALGLAYDFALAAEARGDDYAELLEDSGMKAQARAPMTPIVKLVFGIDYDKSRLTEFAAALAHGRRQAVAAGAMREFLERYKGGLKAVVKAERDARAPLERKSTRTDAAFARLRAVEPRAIVSVEPGEEEFVLLIARRVSGEAVGVVQTVVDQALVERAIRSVPKAG